MGGGGLTGFSLVLVLSIRTLNNLCITNKSFLDAPVGQTVFSLTSRAGSEKSDFSPVK